PGVDVKHPVRAIGRRCALPDAANLTPLQLVGGRIRVEEAPDGAEIVGDITNPRTREALSRVDRVLSAQLPAGPLAEPAGSRVAEMDMIEDRRIVGGPVARSLVAGGEIDLALAVQPHRPAGID